MHLQLRISPPSRCKDRDFFRNQQVKTEKTCLIRKFVVPLQYYKNKYRVYNSLSEIRGTILQDNNLTLAKC